MYVFGSGIPGLATKPNMLVKTINHSGLIAWCPKFEENSLVATGSAIKKTGKDLVSKSRLDIFDLSNETSCEVASIDVLSTFNRILWTSVEASYKDLIVGSFEDGRIELYDTQMLINGEHNGVVEVPKLHSGPVKGMCSSRFQPNLIASGSTNGEIALWDLNNVQKASLMEFKKSEKFSAVTDLAWSPKVSHIIAAASDSGVVSIIDLRSKKEVSTIFLPNFDPVSSISWNPDIPTIIATATTEGCRSCVYLWDLKDSSAPKNIFNGHSNGITSLEWCPKDAKMILSSGKDSNILCWNPESNDIIKEYRDCSAFDVKWCPSDPNIFAMTTPTEIKIRSINENLQGNLNCYDPQAAPRWFTCPIGASFGGSNLCSVFHSNSQRVSLMKPKIYSIANVFENLLKFENIISQGSFLEACNMLINDENNSDVEFTCNIIKFYSSLENPHEFLEFVDQIRHDPDYLINILPDEIESIPLNSSDLDANEVSEKVVKCDFEGAMIDCLKAGCFTEALLIAKCGESNLQLQAEKYISEHNRCFYINLALSIHHQDFLSLVSSGPLCEWYKILKVICEHANQIALPELAEIFSQRLIDAGMHKHALLFSMVSGNLEQFLQIILENLISPLRMSESDSNKNFIRFIHIYELVRILEVRKPNFVKNISTDSLKITIFEITVKLTYILHAYGYKIEIGPNFFDLGFYEEHFEKKNSELDSFMRSLRTKQETQNLSADDCNRLERLSASLSQDPKFDSGFYQNSSSFNSTDASPKIQYGSLNLPGKAANPNYNDVPIINSKLSKLSPHLNSEEIKPGDICSGLTTLFDAVESNSVAEFNGRMIQECKKKLSSEFICSKKYSDLASPFIASLFIELTSGNFEQSAVLASNILASFFAETKDWILPLKRLIELAKARK